MYTGGRWSKLKINSGHQENQNASSETIDCVSLNRFMKMSNMFTGEAVRRGFPCFRGRGRCAVVPKWPALICIPPGSRSGVLHRFQPGDVCDGAQRRILMKRAFVVLLCVGIIAG